MMRITIPSLKQEHVTLALLVTGGLAGSAIVFTIPYLSNTNVIIGLLLFPFALIVKGATRNNVWYLIATVIFLSLAAYYGVRIFFFFAIAFYVLWIVERFFGRVSSIALFLIVFMSPFFLQVVTILGFPLRLALSKWAGTLLTATGADIQVQGNLIVSNGIAFSVDEPCMGLNMLSISMLMGVFILAYHCRRSGQSTRLFPNAVFFTSVLALNVITNVFRIVILVFFRIPPEDPMHEIAGVLCLLVYVVVPLQFVSAWFVRKFGYANESRSAVPLQTLSTSVLAIILPMAIILSGIAVNESRPGVSRPHSIVAYPNGHIDHLDDGVTKVSTSDLLIYVKTIPEFFSGEHTPLMCWKGSGYAFDGITTKTIAGVSIYKGTLKKDGTKLHTAWWYNNGHTQTISQMDWRMRMLKGEPAFTLVNITANDEATLIRSLESIITKHSLVINSPPNENRN